MLIHVHVIFFLRMLISKGKEVNILNFYYFFNLFIKIFFIK